MDVSRLSALTDAITDIAHGTTLKNSLFRLVQSAVILAECEYGAIGSLGVDGQIEDFTYVGMSEESADEISHFPEGKGLLGHILNHPLPLRVSKISEHPASVGFPANHPTMHGFLGVPIKIREEVYGSLYLTQKKSGGDFTADDENLISILAAAAGIAIDNYRGQVARNQVELLAERERIARDLHDLVIQRLFATGISLQSLEKHGLIAEDNLIGIRDAIDSLDQTIQQIRSTIFELKLDKPLEPITMQIASELERLRAIAGFPITFTTNGDVDFQLDLELSKHAVAVARELITNAIKHANATKISLDILTNQTYCEITVIDNGAGYTYGVRRSGLMNLEERAIARGGEFEIVALVDGGTRATWRASL